MNKIKVQFLIAAALQERARQFARLGGKAKSAAKTAACQANGKLGGRPKSPRCHCGHCRGKRTLKLSAVGWRCRATGCLALSVGLKKDSDFPLPPPEENITKPAA